MLLRTFQNLINYFIGRMDAIVQRHAARKENVNFTGGHFHT